MIVQCQVTKSRPCQSLTHLPNRFRPTTLDSICVSCLFTNYVIDCANKIAQIECAVHKWHIARRVHWACAQRRWIPRDQNTVLFSDKSRFNLSHTNGHHRVSHRQGERPAPVCVRQHGPFGGGGVIVRGRIIGGQQTRNIIL